MDYMPTVDRCMRNSTTNKQAARHTDGPELTAEQSEQWLMQLQSAYDNCEQVYQVGLKIGIPKEVARVIVPVGRYSRMRAQANLRNWLGFIALRSDVNPGAQEEIRLYGNATLSILEPLFPRTIALFNGAT
jgi:thymidylate synthase (FAD)